MEQTSTVALVNSEINKELTKETAGALLATTFKGFTAEKMKMALMEGLLRGFSFKDFLQKDVYALPYGQSYSLVTSIDLSRKIGMRSGIVGKDIPVYEENEDGTIKTCSVTVYKKSGEYIGKYTSLVYFNEYSSGQNLWKTKPRTMIAKVAEAHALRMACPEELGKVYAEEEFDLENRHESRIKEVETITKNNPLSMGNFIKNEEAQEVQGTDSPEN